jgi:hypothetical protein
VISIITARILVRPIGTNRADYLEQRESDPYGKEYMKRHRPRWEPDWGNEYSDEDEANAPKDWRDFLENVRNDAG